MSDPRIAGFQVQPDVLTGYCVVCGALLGDITAHLAWHDRPQLSTTGADHDA